VTFDDQNYVINNFNINRGLSWAALKWSFNVGYSSNWHPLTWISHALDCQWFGMRPGPMHLVNTFLHTLNSLLLFLLLRGMTGQIWPSAFVAALFAWHPMHVESVAWISERKDVLSALFFLLTIWAYWRWTRQNSPPARLAWYLTSLALFALGLMAKPMIVTLPLVLLLVDFWPLGRMTPFKRTTARLAFLCLEKLPFFALSAASCALTLIAQARGGAIQSLAALPLAFRLQNALISYERYLDKLIWPRGLNVFYPFNSNLPASSALWPAFLILALCAMGVCLRRSHPYLLSGWLWCLATLVPVIGLVQVGNQAMADRYSYIPSIGVFIVVCWGLADIVKNRPLPRLATVVLGVAALGACLISARAQVFSWRNGGALFQRAIDVDPNNSVAHADLAAYLLISQDWDHVNRECQTALRLDPDYAPTHEYLGYALFKQGRYNDAVAQFHLALRLDPNKHDINLQLGDVYLAQGLPDDAAAQYRSYLAYNDADPSAHFALGKALIAQGKWQDARDELSAALQPSLPFPEARVQLALTLSKTGHIAEAIDQYHTALRYAANDLEALNNLA